MKFAVVLALFSSSFVLAKVPSVKCQLTYSAMNSRGSLIGKPETNPTVVIGTKETTDENEGFVLKGTLNQVCATTHGPCYDAYDLDLTIANGQSIAYLNEHIVHGQAKSRTLNLALDLHDQQGFARCLIGAGSLPKPQ